jgi:hypothetical protein
VRVAIPAGLTKKPAIKLAVPPPLAPPSLSPLLALHLCAVKRAQPHVRAQKPCAFGGAVQSRETSSVVSLRRSSSGATLTNCG